MSKESFVTFFRSKLFAGIVAGVCIMLVAICVFEAGVVVGYHEASFSARWGANYGRNFGGPTGIGLPDTALPDPNGISGKILSISTDTASSTTLVVTGTQNPEEKVLVDSGTIIRNHENTIDVSSLTVGSYAVVVGTPNDQGEIEAKLIRIVPN